MNLKHTDFKSDFPKSSKEYCREYRIHIKTCHPETQKQRENAAKERASVHYSMIAKPKYLALKEDLILSMGGACQKCGKRYKGNNAFMFSFHHYFPSNKDFNLSGGNIIKKEFSVVQNEVSKCALLCENCHRQLHSGVMV